MKTYSINELSLITGLTTRTLRNYLKDGLLEGEKPDGNWVFTDEQISSFVSHPSVAPSIQAKNKAIVYDFLGNIKKEKHEGCIILDYHLPELHAHHLCAVLCNEINHSEFKNIRFSFEHKNTNARFILSGPDAFIQNIMNLAAETIKNCESRN